MKGRKILLLGFIVLAFLAGCGSSASVCPPGSVTYPEEPDAFPTAPPPAEPNPTPSSVQIGSKTIEVDRVIEGPLCNDNLQGIVYVACDLQVKKWDEQPNFLDGCDFNVAAGTVIYVAAHNNAAYYNGCVSCHASSAEGP